MSRLESKRTLELRSGGSEAATILDFPSTCTTHLNTLASPPIVVGSCEISLVTYAKLDKCAFRAYLTLSFLVKNYYFYTLSIFIIIHLAYYTIYYYL